MTEVFFYHLDRQPLERALPALLEKCLERGWRAVVQAGSVERRDALDSHLWTYADDAFLPHGTTRDGPGDLQPVFLTDGQDTPNGATVRFLVDRAEPGDFTPFQRVVYLFDGEDEEARAEARLRWKQAKAAGHDVTYWKQSSSGRWEKAA